MLMMAEAVSLRCKSRARPGSLRRVEFFPGVLDHRDRRDLDIGKLSVLLLEAPDIDVLDDVAGLGFAHDWPARAVWVFPVLELWHCLVAGELSLRRFDQIEDRHHSVPGIDRQEIRDRAVGIFPLPGREKVRVSRSLAYGRIIAGGDQAQRRIAHRRQLLFG